LYIGRGSTKRGRGQSFWANPFFIGRDGGWREVIEKVRKHIESYKEMQLRLADDWAGKHPACHWAVHEPCHADALIEFYLQYRLRPRSTTGPHQMRTS